MPLTKEQLLIPRYKVIADYPQSPYNGGDEHKFIEGDLLVQCNVNGTITFTLHDRLGYMSVGVPCCANPERYPKIFELLPWWSDRKIEDMPEYMKDDSIEGIHKVKWYESDPLTFTINDDPRKWACNQFVMSFFTPATGEEYRNQKHQ